MRTLNRPMFRYGGPIKEGIMNGIREPKQNGGTIAGGNQIGMPMGNRTGFADPVKGAGYFSKLGGALANFYSPLKKARPIQKIINKIKPTFKKQPGIVTGGDASTKAKYMSQTMPKVPFMERAGAFVKENPYFTGAAAPFAVSGALTAAPPVAKGLAGLAEAGVKQVGDLLVPDFIFDQDKYYEDKNKISKKIDNKVKKTPEQVEADKVAAALKAEQAVVAKAEFAEKEKTRRLENYRKIMDIEGMNKDAAYDSLIAASQAISGEGDFKGSIKDGSLINKIIGSTSKAFDKPRDTKNAINTLLLKNQMAADTPSTALKDLIALGIDTPEKQEMYLRTKMGLPVNLGAAKAVATKSGAIGDAITIQAAQSMYGDDYKGVIMDKDTFTKRFEEATDKGAGRPNEIITGLIADEARTNEYPPGKYSVGDVVVTIDEEFNVKIER